MEKMWSQSAGSGGGLGRKKLNRSALTIVHPEMVDFGLGQGRSGIETAGVVALRRGFQSSENVGMGRKMPFLDGH